MKRGASRSLARRILEAAFERHGRVEVGRARQVGEGLSREVLAAYVEIDPDPAGLSGAYTVSLPGRHAEPGKPPSPKREAMLLERVAAATTAIRIPTTTAILPVDGGDAVVRPYIEGIPLDLRAGRQGVIEPWEIVAEVAATIHGIDVAALPDLPGHATRRAHAIAKIATLEGVPALREVVAWAHDHLPPEEPSSLVHGDLLGQNILLYPDEPPAVIDWELAMLGDPAYDLAIVTRGARQPFQIGGGLQRLLDAYASRGGRHVTACDVHLHELCMVGGWYRAAVEGTSYRESLEQALAHVNNVLSRARRAETRSP